MSGLKRTGPGVTDVAGELAGPSQFQRMYTRYYWARQYCAGRRVLEIACGTGQGLGALGRVAQSVTALDYSQENLRTLQRIYGSRFPVAAMDAQRTGFRDASFDVALIFEVLYFLPDADACLGEAHRVLRPGSTLLLSVINRDTADFAPSPLYVETYGVRELAAKCRAHGFAPTFEGALPVTGFSWRSRFLRPVKRVASRLNLIPNSMQARIWLKRMVFGSLAPLPAELVDDEANYPLPVPLPPDRADTTHQLLLCAAVRD